MELAHRDGARSCRPLLRFATLTPFRQINAVLAKVLSLDWLVD